MARFTLIDPPEGGGDLAVTLTDDSLFPYFRPGERVCLLRQAELADGDVGLFHSRKGMVFRQICQDSQGTVYLFSVNRKYRRLDRAVPAAETEDLVCYGKLILPRPIPLPND